MRPFPAGARTDRSGGGFDGGEEEGEIGPPDGGQRGLRGKSHHYVAVDPERFENPVRKFGSFTGDPSSSSSGANCPVRNGCIATLTRAWGSTRPQRKCRFRTGPRRGGMSCGRGPAARIALSASSMETSGDRPAGASFLCEQNRTVHFRHCSEMNRFARWT